MDEYNTTYHIGDFNDGKGLFVEFFNNRTLSGEPAVTGYYDRLNFSTFGGYGFANGVNTNDVSVRISGRFVPDFTGPLNYALASDGDHVLTGNGKVVEKSVPGMPSTRGFGFRGATPTKTFQVEAGKPYDIKIEYRQGSGQFAMLNAEFCERRLAEFSDLAEQVKDADAIIVVGGISSRFEGEGGDRSTIELPAVQQRLVKAMHETGRPVVFVSCSGSAIAFASVEDQYDALLQAWYGGQAGAAGLADVIFGDYNPSGNLPVTFYASNSQLPDFLDYNMEGHTYRYFRGEPLYAFGYGLSYTTFSYGEGKLSKPSVKAGKGVSITVPVTNTGSVGGEETVQVYVKRLDDAGAPIKSLKGFKKVSIDPGQTVKVKIDLAPEAFEYYDEMIDELSIMPGRYRILYGSSSREADLKSIDFQVI